LNKFKFFQKDKKPTIEKRQLKKRNTQQKKDRESPYLMDNSLSIDYTGSINNRQD